jgi:IstB-like ATP binding protein
VDAEFAEHSRAGEIPRATPRQLVPPSEEVAHPIIDMTFDVQLGQAQGSVAEVARPTPRQAVQSVAHVVPSALVARHQQIADLVFDPSRALLRWTGAQIPLAIPLPPLRAERVAKEVEPLLAGTKDQAETSVLFELIAARYERHSMLITANQPFGEWGKIFPDPAMTLASIDCLVHHATILEMNVEIYRRRAALDRKRTKKIEPSET